MAAPAPLAFVVTDINRGPGRRKRGLPGRVERCSVGHIWIEVTVGSGCDLYVTYRSGKWSGRLDSNQRPPAPKAGKSRSRKRLI